MGEGFLPFAPARSERGELWAAPLLVLLASSRRTTARAADGHGLRGVLSHVLLEAPLPSRFFFPLSSSLGVFRLCFFSAYSSPPGWDSCPRLPRRQRSCATRSCAALLFALRVGRGNPTTRQENENDGRGGVTDDHLRRMRLSRPPRPNYSVSYLYVSLLKKRPRTEPSPRLRGAGCARARPPRRRPSPCTSRRRQATPSRPPGAGGRRTRS